MTQFQFKMDRERQKTCQELAIKKINDMIKFLLPLSTMLKFEKAVKIIVTGCLHSSFSFWWAWFSQYGLILKGMAYKSSLYMVRFGSVHFLCRTLEDLHGIVQFILEVKQHVFILGLICPSYDLSLTFQKKKIIINY